MKIVKLAEEISMGQLYMDMVQNQGKTPEQAAEEVLGILTNGAFDMVEEPNRSRMIQGVIGKYTLPSAQMVR